ncbi:glutathione S-transferase kappa 1-like isoform X2 [Ptychodera flava]|uniref:glutathione S-transferase kappa 1-like isoform X2 n=1 Tax=Ptychodera flava TaxID=63121 RepID=UPI00396A08DF
MAAPARRTIELFYDVISPYAWIGFEVSLDIVPVPEQVEHRLAVQTVFPGAVMAAVGNRGVTQAIKVYGYKDLERNRDHFQIPIVKPKNIADLLFVKGSLQAQRLLTAVSMHEGNDAMENISRQLYLRVWSKAAKKAGFSEEKAQNLVSRIKDQDIKDQLKDNTQNSSWSWSIWCTNNSCTYG